MNKTRTGGFSKYTKKSKSNGNVEEKCLEDKKEKPHTLNTFKIPKSWPIEDCMYSLWAFE